MSWPSFPKRLQSALKALCCLAESGSEMQSQEIAQEIGVSSAETAKILQLLVWGGFVTSKRGSKGGFQLASPPERITMGEVIDFFLSRHPLEPDGKSPVMRALRDSMAPCQRAFGKLSLTEVARVPRARGRKTRSARNSRTRREDHKKEFDEFVQRRSYAPSQ